MNHHLIFVLLLVLKLSAIHSLFNFRNSPVKKRKEDGEECRTAEDCKSRVCSYGGSCYSLRAGERCMNKYMCGSYRSCVDGVCTGKLDGEPCTLNDQCESEFCSSGNVCTKGQKRRGMSCTKNDQCASGLCKAKAYPYGKKVCTKESSTTGASDPAKRNLKMKRVPGSDYNKQQKKEE